MNTTNTTLFPGHELRPEDFTREQLVAALECVHMLADDYARGWRRGGNTDWEDLDATYDATMVSFPDIEKRAREFALRRDYAEWAEYIADNGGELLSFEDWAKDENGAVEAGT